MSDRRSRSQQSFLDIPITKFASGSCYSFIVRFNSPASRIELYLPPNANLKVDMQQWLDSYKFVKESESEQIYYTELSQKTKTATVKLLKSASKNGAYEIDPEVEVEDLEDKAIAPNLASEDNLSAKIANTVNTLVEKKLEIIVKSIEKQINRKFEEITIDNNAIAVAEAEAKKYRDLVNNLEAKVKDLEVKLDKVNSEKLHLQKALEEQTTEIFEYHKIFETEEEVSPFDTDSERDSILHLNSPFACEENEITSEEEYDDSELNQKIEPYQSKGFGKKKLDEIEIPQSLFDNPLDALDNIEIEKLASQNGKN